MWVRQVQGAPSLTRAGRYFQKRVWTENTETTSMLDKLLPGVAMNVSSCFRLCRTYRNWGLLGFNHLEELPGIRWTMKDLDQLANINTNNFAARAVE